MPDAPASPDPNPSRLLLPAAFACSSTHGDQDATCVHVAGDLDMATAPQLELTLRGAQARTRVVVLDLCDVAFIDSAGVHAIVNAAAHARENGRRLVVLRGPANVERLFTLTGTGDELERGDAATASGRVGERPYSRGAGATDRAPATGTLLSRAVAAVPWLRSAPASELTRRAGAEAGATPDV